jgi:hypothetical protein
VLSHDEGEFHIGAWEKGRHLVIPQTLSAWKASFKIGSKLRCTYRWHTPNVDEVVTIQKVQTNAVAFDYLDGNRPPSLKAGELRWMDFPRRTGICFTHDGFELLKQDGTLMSRYHWL